MLGLVGVRVPGAGRRQRRAADRQAGAEHRREPGQPAREAVLALRVDSPAAMYVGSPSLPSGASAARTPPANAAARAACATAGSRDLDERAADVGERRDRQVAGRAPRAGRPEAEVLGRVDGGDRHAGGGQRRAEAAAHRDALERVVGGPDAVDQAAEPAGAHPGVDRADLPEVTRDEVRLVRVVVADRRQHRDLALGVQGGQRRRGGMPGQPRVLGERAAAFGQREGRPQAAVLRVAGRRQDREAVGAAVEEHVDEHGSAASRLGAGDALLEGRQARPRRRRRARGRPSAAGTTGARGRCRPERACRPRSPAGRRRRGRARRSRCGRRGSRGQVVGGHGDQHPQGVLGQRRIGLALPLLVGRAHRRRRVALERVPRRARQRRSGPEP